MGEHSCYTNYLSISEQLNKVTKDLHKVTDVFNSISSDLTYAPLPPALPTVPIPLPYSCTSTLRSLPPSEPSGLMSHLHPSPEPSGLMSHLHPSPEPSDLMSHLHPSPEPSGLMSHLHPSPEPSGLMSHLQLSPEPSGLMSHLQLSPELSCLMSHLHPPPEPSGLMSHLHPPPDPSGLMSHLHPPLEPSGLMSHLHPPTEPSCSMSHLHPPPDPSGLMSHLHPPLEPSGLMSHLHPPPEPSCSISNLQPPPSYLTSLLPRRCSSSPRQPRRCSPSPPPLPRCSATPRAPSYSTTPRQSRSRTKPSSTQVPCSRSSIPPPCSGSSIAAPPCPGPSTPPPCLGSPTPPPCPKLPFLTDESCKCKCYQTNKAAYSDWFICPLHKPFHIFPKDYIINQHYRPGYLGALFNMKRTLDVWDQKICKSHRRAHKRITTAIGNDFNKYKTDGDRLLNSKLYNLKSNNARDPLFNVYLQLARLQLDKLHLKEELLLEAKRQEELERTRPPQKYWYMLRTREFTPENIRNRNMVKHAEYLKDILSYRKRLLKASQNAHRHFLKHLY